MSSGRRQMVRYTDHRIIGHPDDVAALLRAHRADGTLIGMRAPRPVPGRDLVAVSVRLRDQQPAPVVRSSRIRWVVAGVVVGTGALAGLGYLTYLALQAVIPLLPAAVGTLILLGLIWAALGQVGACPGLHCPGCKHR